ncbi:Mucin-associated surface protein (MASP) [Trypanosoma cruzi]|uniref:Mucin-associated surface protein (MASP), putative n=3 Tax=Trypanosoma cruzi TaxID=5693 RepID=Q4D7K4_TRYCC|nr:mucin-associated surface protein (MASP), putative [Trypanosoma cruzi]EAN88509.1 mucin-associated surface protein (MASP), putative [Trypanosoma cruzi]PWV17720.1 Mucin-associated surface protein (MASP) [Trypanosoma cruzi]|eukprot:XP_810360.1 mucin-associated surface protein (MASP) [Trypanosoma cruzi strain CL Brener]
MMMTGRVLLVCALCVLWCGAGWVYAREFENNALGGCMASGALGASWYHMPSGCDKAALTPPLRSALPIPAIKAEASEDDVPLREEDDSISTSGAVVGTAMPGESDGAGLVIQSGPPAGGVAPTTPSGGSSTQNMESQRAVQHLEPTDPAASVLLKVEVPGEPMPIAEESLSNTQDRPEIRVTGEDNTEREKLRSAVDTGDRFSDQPKEPTPPLKTTPQLQPTTPVPPPSSKASTTELSSGEGNPQAATTDTQTPTPTIGKTTTSETATDYKAPKTPSKDDEAEQHSKERVPSDLMKNTANGHPADTKASSIPTIGSGDVQRNADKNGNDAQRPDTKGTHKDPAAVNTNDTLTASVAAPQTTERLADAKTNHTVTPGDSDSSTAVSHTTSPLLLLLLLVACAAAAAVVAA